MPTQRVLRHPGLVYTESSKQPGLVYTESSKAARAAYLKLCTSTPVPELWFSNKDSNMRGMWIYWRGWTSVRGCLV